MLRCMFLKWYMLYLVDTRSHDVIEVIQLFKAYFVRLQTYTVVDSVIMHGTIVKHIQQLQNVNDSPG